MGENRFCNSASACPSSHAGITPSEMVCIDAQRILDSCRDRDCFEHVRVYLTEFGNEIIERTSSLRVKCAEIKWTYIGVDPVQFNKGFYSINIKFYVKLTLEACLGPGKPQEFEGVAVIEKRVILYGGESNLSIFKSGCDTSNFCAEPSECEQCKNVPTVSVEVVDPIILGVKVVEDVNECCCNCCCCCCDIPEGVCGTINGALEIENGEQRRRFLAVSIGLFSVIRITRPGQFIINASEFCVPDKECISPKENDPCSIFRTMAFPTGEFCSQSLPISERDKGRGKCGC